jgi:hypothetical protein
MNDLEFEASLENLRILELRMSICDVLSSEIIDYQHIPVDMQNDFAQWHDKLLEHVNSSNDAAQLFQVRQQLLSFAPFKSREKFTNTVSRFTALSRKIVNKRMPDKLRKKKTIAREWVALEFDKFVERSKFAFLFHLDEVVMEKLCMDIEAFFKEINKRETKLLRKKK